MLLLGQLLDVLDNNEVVTLKGRNIIFIEELKLSEAKQLLTKEARTLVVEQLYSDTIQKERTIEGSQTVIYIKPNGLFIRNGEVTN